MDRLSSAGARTKLQAMLDATAIMVVQQPAAEAVTAFARFAYIFGGGKFKDLGAAFADEIVFNGTKMTLKDF